MDIFVYAFVCILSFIAALKLCRYAFKKSIEIKFKYSKFDWILPISIALLSFLVAFILEWGLGLIVVKMVNPQKGFWSMIIYKLFENGVLIPLICPLISWIFEKMIESLNLDYLALYSAMVSKICFSVIIISVCIRMFSFFINGSEENIDADFTINRIIMWMLTVIGTWVGIGFKCEGRIEKEKKKKKRKFGKKEQREFWVPIIVCLVAFIIFVYKIDVLKNIPYLMKSIMLFSVFFTIFVYILLLIYSRKYNPSEKRSIKIYEKAVKSKSEDNHRFGRMIYHIEADEVIIHKDERIKYERHENDKRFKRLFGDKKITIRNNEYVINELKKRSKDQKEYIELEIKKCINLKKTELLNK